MNQPERPAELAEFPVVIRWPVQWGDQDAFGHVNNTVPIRWFESARIAYLEQSGMGDLMTDPGLGPILAAISCAYRRQITYPDTVQIGSRISRLGRSSMTMLHAVFSEAHGALAAEGESTIVIFDYQANRPRRIPADLRDKIQKLEGKRLCT